MGQFASAGWGHAVGRAGIKSSLHANRQKVCIPARSQVPAVIFQDANSTNSYAARAWRFWRCPMAFPNVKNMTTSRLIALGAVTLCSAALLVGCGSSSTSDTAASSDTTAAKTTAAATTATTTASTTVEKVGGTASCTRSSLAQAVTENNKTNKLIDFNCASGWAVVTTCAANAQGKCEYDNQFPAVFEAEGQFWIPKTQSAALCKTAGNPIPAALYEDACSVYNDGVNASKATTSSTTNSSTTTPATTTS